MNGSRSSVSGRRKAAIVLVSLDSETAASILKHMKDEEIEQLTLEIATLGKVSPAQRDATVSEFYQLALAQEYIAQGGIDYAKRILEKALGASRAMEIINRLSASLQVTPFDFVRYVSPEQLTNFIEGEHPQTIALIVAHLRPDQAALVLSALTPELQADVALRVAQMEGARRRSSEGRGGARTQADKFRHSGVLGRRVKSWSSVAERRSIDKKVILERLEGENRASRRGQEPDVRLRGHSLHGRSLRQVVIREVESKDLALSSRLRPTGQG